MLPPLPGQFSNHDELFSYVQTFAINQGYAITIKRSRTDRNDEIKNTLLGCNRSGSYRERLDHSRHRMTALRLINCPFELFATRCSNVWHLEIHNSEHNHKASEDMSGYSIVRQLNSEQREQVQIMADAGAHPCQILATIHQNNSSSMAISQTIYNILYSIRQEKLNACMPIQALLDELQGSDFEFEYKSTSATSDSHLNPCTVIFKSTMGLPCSHVISEHLATGQPLQQADIHKHWWIQGRHFKFLKPIYSANENNTDLQPLLQSLTQLYQFWPPHQQAIIYA
ncbi:9068_t:CDS:2 [Cetraspora pellucida]|uniref:9068_t:CDS:1 n=1 Tax=Cetraspora pellucida TaxID=1433469 RepID=A0A9N9DZ06_9GLOM|nr:9068_t:CDS:2 [Cetraspora pellucida]